MKGYLAPASKTSCDALGLQLVPRAASRQCIGVPVDGKTGLRVVAPFSDTVAALCLLTGAPSQQSYPHSVALRRGYVITQTRATAEKSTEVFGRALFACRRRY